MKIPYIDKTDFDDYEFKKLKPTGRYKFKENPYFNRETMFVEHKDWFFKRWISEHDILFVEESYRDEGKEEIFTCGGINESFSTDAGINESFSTDAGYKLTVHKGWDRDGELELEVETGVSSLRLYLCKSDIVRLRNALNIELGE